MQLGLLAAAASAGIWIVLALVSGLIFHLLPAAPPLVGAWAYRAAGGSRRARAAIVLASAGVALSLLASGLLAAAQRPLDDAWFTILTQLAGAALAIALVIRVRLGSPR